METRTAPSLENIATNELLFRTTLKAGPKVAAHMWVVCAASQNQRVASERRGPMLMMTMTVRMMMMMMMMSPDIKWLILS